MMATNRTLLEQARELQALAQTGLMYCKDPFDRERYERIRAMAVDMLSTQVDAPAGQDHFRVVADLLRLVRQVVRIHADAETRHSCGHLR